MVLSGKTVREIHKEIYKLTPKMPKMYLFMEKVANRAYKTIDKRKNNTENAELLWLLFSKMKYNDKIKKVINKTVIDTAERGKQRVIKNYINDSRSVDKWIYLASSHNDCAKDHLAYQGKLYYDANAPEEVVKWCYSRGLYSIQWVMGDPVWFITRPNCRHFFKSLSMDVVKQYSVKELTRRYKTHRMDGDKSLATPRGVALEEYEDRLKLLHGLYNQQKTERLRREIDKVELLIKKWKKVI